MEAYRRISRTVRFDRGNQEFRKGYLTDVVDEPTHFRAKTASVERDLARQILRSVHFERGLTRRRVFDRAQPSALEAGIEKTFRDGFGPRPTPAKGSGQLTEPRVELLRLMLQRERIGPRIELFQK